MNWVIGDVFKKGIDEYVIQNFGYEWISKTEFKREAVYYKNTRSGTEYKMEWPRFLEKVSPNEHIRTNRI